MVSSGRRLAMRRGRSPASRRMPPRLLPTRRRPLAPAVVPAVARRRGGAGCDPGGCRPFIPLIHDDLHLSEAQVGLLIGLPLGLFAAAAVPGALLVARIGMRRTMLIGLALTALASAGRSASLNVWMLYGTTALMGFGVAINAARAAGAGARMGADACRVGHRGLDQRHGDRRNARLGAVHSLRAALGGESWRLDLVLWSALTGAIAIVFAAVSPRAVSADPDLTTAPKRWWPDWKSPLTWLLGLAFGSTNALYYGANAFLPRPSGGAWTSRPRRRGARLASMDRSSSPRASCWSPPTGCTGAHGLPRVSDR